MNVTLSKRGSYAAAAAICLARAYESGLPKKLREISAEMAIPRTFASQILGDLVHAGIAVSSPGRGGGHRLARPPGEVSVAEVIEAAEGPLASERCALREGPCRWTDVCPLHETMTMATASLRAVLAASTLAMLAERDAAMALGTYPIPADSHRHAVRFTVTDSVQIELAASAVAARLTAATAWLTAQAQAVDPEEARGDVGADGQGKTVAIHLGQLTQPGEAQSAETELAETAPAEKEPAETEPAEAQSTGTRSAGTESDGTESDGTQADESLLIPLVWEAAGPFGVFTRFQGYLRLTALDPARSELRLSGSYRTAPGTDAQLSADAAARRARDRLRSFLRRIASALEQEQAHSSASSLFADRRSALVVQLALRPPSTDRVAPLMVDASSLTRNAAACPTPRGQPCPRARMLVHPHRESSCLKGKRRDTFFSGNYLNERKP